LIGGTPGYIGREKRPQGENPIEKGEASRTLLVYDFKGANEEELKGWWEKVTNPGKRLFSGHAVWWGPSKRRVRPRPCSRGKGTK